MDKQKIEELIRLVEESDISELQVTNFLGSVRIVKDSHGGAGREVVHVPPPRQTPAPVQTPAAAPEPQAPLDRDSGLAPIVSPMVGTFYGAPSPEAPPYVKQGDHVNKGQVVCIIEAMKLMNEIESEHSGTIVRIEAENGQPVEFGQALFMIQPD